jgi:K+-sensing histidine kinase KdpD
MDNADKYGTRPTAVGVSRRDRSGRPVVVTTVDSPGPALPPEDIRLALEPFWRGERAVTTCPGMGLGLTVARTLAQHEGGRLWVEPRQGGGLITLLELEAA